MIDLSPDQLQMVKRILVEFVPDKEVRAFGSRVIGTAKNYSDLDLAVVGDQSLDPDVLRHLREAFEESDLPFRVDVLDWKTTSETFRNLVERECEVVQKGKSRAGS